VPAGTAAPIGPSSVGLVLNIFVPGKLTRIRPGSAEREHAGGGKVGTASAEAGRTKDTANMIEIDKILFIFFN